MTGRVCEVHGEWSATGICRWCEPSDTVQMEYVPTTAHPPAGMPVKGVTAEELAAWYDWTRVDAVELLDGLPPVVVCPDNIQAAMNELWLRLSTRGGATAFFPHTLVLADESRIAEEHAALRWERVARRWATQLPIRCCCGESELDSFGDSRMFRHGTRKWKRHTIKRCDCDIVNPMCQCGEWLFDANYHVAYSVPFAHFTVDVIHTPEGCHPAAPP